MDLTIERREEYVAQLTLNRPHRRNALDLDQVGEISRSLDDVASDPDVRVLVFTGAGSSFCAGLDLKGSISDEEPMGVVELLAFQRRFSSLVRQVRYCRLTIVGAINGPAFGAGFALALAFDTLVAGTGARFNIGTVNIGLSAGECGVSYHLPRAVGWVRSNEILLTGRDVLADEALRIGLVADVAGDPVARAHEVAARIAAHPPFALAMTKEMLWSGLAATSLDQAIHVEDRTQVLASLTGDMARAAEKFAK